MSKKSILQKKKHKKNKADNHTKQVLEAARQELINNPRQDFELQIGDGDDTEILNGDVEVRWCLTPELIDVLNQQNVVDPHILLISTVVGKRESMSRQLIPLTQLKTYVRSNKAGPINIHAWIINGAEGRKEINKKYMRVVNGSYQTDMIDYSGTGYVGSGDVAQYTVLEIDIPEGVFGKEPGPRMKKFVNLWHSNKPVDECNYRQRKLIAFTVKWEAMIIFAIFAAFMQSAVSLVVAGLGFRKCVHWKRVLQVFTWEALHVWETDLYPGWITNDYVICKQTPQGKQGLFFLAPFAPTLVAIVFAFVTIVTDNIFEDTVILTSLILMWCSIVLAVIDVVVSLIIWAAHTKFWGYMGKQFAKLDKLLHKRNHLGWKIVGGGLASVIGYVVVIVVIAYWDILQYVFLLIGLLILGMVIIGVLLTLFYKFFTIDAKHNDINQVRELLCNDCETAVASNEPRVVAFPSKQRRIKLWYLETKHKVCKPMQS